MLDDQVYLDEAVGGPGVDGQKICEYRTTDTTLLKLAMGFDSGRVFREAPEKNCSHLTKLKTSVVILKVKQWCK